MNKSVALILSFISLNNFCAENFTILELKGHAAVLEHALFDSTGAYAITADSHIIKIWDSKSSMCLQSFENPANIQLVGMSKAGKARDNQLVYSVSDDNLVRIWHLGLESEPIIIRHSDQPKQFVKVAFTDDGRYVLTAGNDSIAKLWDINDKSCKATYAGHTAGIYLVTFDKIGSYIATASYDNTIRIWTKDGLSAPTIINSIHRQTRLKFDKTGAKLTLISDRGGTQVWDMVQNCLIKPFDCWIKKFPLLINYLREETTLFHNSSFTRVCTSDGDQCSLWAPGTSESIQIKDAFLRGCSNPFNKHYGDRIITLKSSDAKTACIHIDKSGKKVVTALALALHPRLGDSSPAQILSQDLFVMIHKKMLPYSLSM